MYSSLNNKIALVTGGSGGIGKAVIRELLENQCRIFSTSRNAYRKNKDLVEKYGPNKIYNYDFDFENHNELQEVVSECIRRFGKIDYLIHCAGVSDNKCISESSIDAWQKVIRLNLDAAMLLSKYAIQYMVCHGGGSIVFVSSLGCVRCWKSGTAYQTSKTAIEGLSRSIAVDYAASNIRSNCVRPGLIDAPMYLNSINYDSEETSRICKRIPLNRLGKPEEVAHLVVFLCSDEASYITGGVMTVDGGYSIGDE